MEADVSGCFSPQIRTLGLEPAPPLAWLAVAPTPPQWGGTDHFSNLPLGLCALPALLSHESPSPFY